VARTSQEAPNRADPVPLVALLCVVAVIAGVAGAVGYFLRRS